MPFTASKIATCISTYTRAVATEFPLVVELARTDFSALRFHSVTASCAAQAALSSSESANSPRTPHGQVCDARFLISQLVLINPPCPARVGWQLMLLIALSLPGARLVSGEQRGDLALAGGPSP